MLTRLEEEVYNTYLATTRSQQNKPFKLRQNFKGFEKKKEYGFIQKLANFFKKFPQIKMGVYFKAPFEIYPDTKHFPLTFYTSPKGIKVYSLYFKKLQEQSPDSPEQLEYIRKSLHFIGMFCIKNKISLKEYLDHQTGVTYSWMQHVKKHEVSLYALLEFPDLEKRMYAIQEDERGLLLGDLPESVTAYKTRYFKSIHAKQLVKEGINRIDKHLVTNK